MTFNRKEHRVFSQSLQGKFDYIRPCELGAYFEPFAVKNKSDKFFNS